MRRQMSQPGCSHGLTPLGSRAGHTAPETTQNVCQWEPKRRVWELRCDRVVALGLRGRTVEDRRWGRIARAEGLTPVGGARRANDEPLAWGLAGWSGRGKSI